MKNFILLMYLLNDKMKYGSIFFLINKDFWAVRFLSVENLRLRLKRAKCLSAMEIALALSWLVARQITGRKRPCTDYDSRDVAGGRICMCLWMLDASSLVNVTSVPVTDREGERAMTEREGRREKNRPSVF